MNIICDSKRIIDVVRTKGKIKEALSAGFSQFSFNCTAVCDPMEFEFLKLRNFKRERDFYLTEEPERLIEAADSLFFNNALELGFSLPVAMAPYTYPDVKAENINNGILRALAKETLKAADSFAGANREVCNAVIIHPITAGIDAKDLWATNKAFFKELGDLADSLGSNIQILLINKCRNNNGHLIRGFLAETEEICRFVDELNDETGAGVKGKAPRFACCFDFGVATLCGQDVYEAIVPLGERLKAVIVRDCDGIHDVSMLPFTACFKGQQSDWLGLIRGLRKLDFDGDLIMDFSDTYSSFSDRLKPEILRTASRTGDYLAWQIGMNRMVKKYDKRVLFGAGNMCRAYMKDYGQEYPPLFTCDNNSARWGEEFCGLTIESPDKLKELSPDVAIFLCNIYYDEIEQQLRRMGLENPIERFNDEYMQTFHMDRLKMAKEPVTIDGGKRP